VNFNRVILGGRLTCDVETRETQDGTIVGNGCLAVNRRHAGRGEGGGGEQREETCFVDFEIWGRAAATLARWLGKGDPVLLEGRLKLDEWEDRRRKLKMVVERFQFAGRGRGQHAPDQDDEERAPARAQGRGDGRGEGRGRGGGINMDPRDVPRTPARSRRAGAANESEDDIPF